MKVKDYGNRGLLREINTLTALLENNESGALKDLLSDLRSEYDNRLRTARNQLWDTRMKTQYAENELRSLLGFDYKEIHGEEDTLEEER